MEIRYAHTNIIAKDWRSLADFYCNVFGCEYLYPERDLAGPWLDQLTHVQGVRIQGTHLRLPGHGNQGPTLEIFSYHEYRGDEGRCINSLGFSHVAFSVDDVDACLRKVLHHGGGMVGEVVHGEVPGVGSIHMVYAQDPEGNIIEIQRWEPPA